MIDPKNDNIKIKEVYHFPGNGVIAPLAVEAESREEAEKLYQEKINNVKKDESVKSTEESSENLIKQNNE